MGSLNPLAGAGLALLCCGAAWARTDVRLLAGVGGEARSCVVAVRPRSGRWHQIRKHLNGLSHPILGDSTHGSSRINREWRARGLARLALHLHAIDLGATPATPALRAAAPLPEDLAALWEAHLPPAAVRDIEETLRALTGQSILGWLSPGKSQSFVTPELLPAQGIEYMCD